MAYNAARRRDVREAEKLRNLAERQRAEIIGGIMSIAPGRSWMCDLLEFCHIFATTFNPTPGLAAFAEGERNVGLRLLNDIMSACPDMYVQMMRERNQRDASRDRASASRDDDTAADYGERPGGEEPGREPEGRPVGGPSDPNGTDAAEDDGWRDIYTEDAGRREAESS